MPDNWTLLLSVISLTIRSEVAQTATLETAVLETHNHYRSLAGLNHLGWDETLAGMASLRADVLKNNFNCNGKNHSEVKTQDSMSNVGESMWLSEDASAPVSEDQLGIRASEEWFAEIKNYKWPGDGQSFNDCGTTSFEQYGRFTQLMWANSRKIGCATATCDGGNNGQYLVCQYEPTGNDPNQEMFSPANLVELRQQVTIQDCDDGLLTTSDENTNGNLPSGGGDVSQIHTITNLEVAAQNVVTDSSLQEAILAEHNTPRVYAGLDELTWSTDLAATSAKFAEEKLKVEYECARTAHSQSNTEYRGSFVGENIFMVSNSQTFSDGELGTKASRAWYAEVSDYKWPGEGESFNSCPTMQFSNVGHFTQIMWQTTKEVGCGIANCQVNNRQYVVCQYKPAGNVVNRPMFTQSNLDQFRQHETIEDCYTPDSGSDTASPSDSDTNDSERNNECFSTSKTLEDFILEKHNSFRDYANYAPLTWSSHLATKASEYGQQVIVRVQNCENVAASEIGPYRDENVGENNYISPLKEPVQESHLGSTASKNWFSAKRYYKLFNENATEYCENDRALPFVQLMWPETTEIGCAVATCDNGKQVLTCQYSPAAHPDDTPLFTEEKFNIYNSKADEPLKKCYSKELRGPFLLIAALLTLHLLRDA